MILNPKVKGISLDTIYIGFPGFLTTGKAATKIGGDLSLLPNP